MTAGRDDFLAQVDVSRETLAQLDVYADLLTKWNPRINLVAPATLPDLWSRHFLDSAQLLECIDTPPNTWVDLGAGAGFPGLVVAMLANDRGWPTEFTLIESDQRKAAFLRTVLRATDIKATVLTDRIDAVAPLNSDIVSARALTDLTGLLHYCEIHLSPAGTAIFPKGRRFEGELTKALETYRFHCEKVPSKTDQGAVILKITEIERV